MLVSKPPPGDGRDAGGAGDRFDHFAVRFDFRRHFPLRDTLQRLDMMVGMIADLVARHIPLALTRILHGGDSTTKKVRGYGSAKESRESSAHTRDAAIVEGQRDELFLLTAAGEGVRLNLRCNCAAHAR